jgi:hypothetical protein
LPRGGWIRAVTYIFHRLRRLPDPPHRIARGVASGVFISFTPLFGLHFVLTTTINWAIGGNFVASVIGNWFGNPVTLPLIAYSSVWLGQWLMHVHHKIDLHALMQITTDMSTELWRNCFAIFTSATMRWDAFTEFTKDYFLPYLLGGVILGLVFSIASHYLTVRAVEAYRRLRLRRMRERADRRLRMQARNAAAGSDRPDGLA